MREISSRFKIREVVVCIQRKKTNSPTEQTADKYVFQQSQKKKKVYITVQFPDWSPEHVSFVTRKHYFLLLQLANQTIKMVITKRYIF